MLDPVAQAAVEQGDNPDIIAILEEVCAATDMGFAALARVTETRWIACQLVDRIEFGLDPGSELEIQTTICNEIRQSGRAVVIDRVQADKEWRTHPIPILYGFQSYASLPVILDDGSFFGTLCAIDTRARRLTAPAVMATLEDCARRVGTILSETARR
jgi:GAF domain-containing protein